MEPCLSVVMPCFNEAATIGEVVRRVLANPYTAELVIVDDGSTDDTLAIARGFTDPRVRVLVQPANRGKGAALRRGLAEARSPYVVVQDADLEYDPEDYAVLLPPLIEGKADVVYGSRFHGSRPHRVLYFWHSVGNRFLTTLSNMFTNLNLSDMETCYKAFRREVLRDLVIEEDRFGFEPEITAKVARAGWRIFEVGISYSGRTYAEGKKIGWRDGVRATYCILRYSPLVDRQKPPVRRRPADFEAADEELAAVLHSLRGAGNYTRWIHDLAAPHLGGEVLEVGAGHGDLTALLRQGREVVATDPSARCTEVLEQRFAGDGVEVRRADVAAAVDGRRYDGIVAVNVLEHIDDDVGALDHLRRGLKPGGRIVVFVPALEALYSDFDRRVGHYRRYRRSDLERTLRSAGLVPVELRYVDLVGVPVWWAFAKQLRQVPTRPWSVALYDRLAMPVIRRVETARRPPLGRSLFAVAAPDPDASS